MERAVKMCWYYKVFSPISVRGYGNVDTDDASGKDDKEREHDYLFCRLLSTKAAQAGRSVFLF